MTLITYPTRVHFADDVLEEALRAELERAGARRLLLVFPEASRAPNLAARVRAGVPAGIVCEELALARRGDCPVDLNDLTQSWINGTDDPDVIVAYGSAHAIDLGRKCRRLLSDKRGHRVPFFAIPGADGLPNPCTRNMESWSSGLPTVLICDPTVTLGSASSQNLRSAVLSMVRCVEAYLAVAYNPPADGIAMEGIHRCIAALPSLNGLAGIDQQREVMAGYLNAALSQEKGLGNTLTLASALAGAALVEEAEAARLLLPEVIRRTPAAGAKGEALAYLFRIRAGEALAEAVARTLAQVPFANCLSDMGVSAAGLDRAAHNAVHPGLSYADARSIMTAVY